jgi:hypothetical protein
MEVILIMEIQIYMVLHKETKHTSIIGLGLAAVSGRQFS